MPKRSRRLAILSAWPPPYGGVTVHTQRLSALLTRAGIKHQVYNAVSKSEAPGVVSVSRFRRSWLFRYLFTAPETAIFILSPRLSMWLAGACLAIFRGKRVLVRIRNARICDWTKSSTCRRALAAFALRRVAGVVCVSREIADTVSALGIADDNIHCLPGFLPPTEQEVSLGSLTEPVREFISNRQPLLVANGKVSFFKDEDLYGIDMLTELATRLRTDYPQLGIAVCLSDNKPATNDYLKKQAAIAQHASAGAALLFNTTPGPLLPLLKKADLFLRPTNTDGDANSVREALYCGVPVIASDAAERPPDVTLFHARDMDDFEKKVREQLISNQAKERPTYGDGEVEARAAQYVEIVRQLID